MRSIRTTTSPRLETLERRNLFAVNWNTSASLIRQDQVAAQFPQLTGVGQTVAVIDTGIDYNNPRLGGGIGTGKKVIDGYDFVDNDIDPMDTYGHGTEVAGLIAGDGFDFQGKYSQGIAPGANLVALRVDAANDPVPEDRIEKALQWVLNNQAKYNIVACNISFGAGKVETTLTSSYSDELALLKQRGVFVAAASGNGGVEAPFGIEYPAGDPSVFSVGAVDAFDVITEYTARAANLDLLAPGDDVYTVTLGPDEFASVSGTSFAVPLVCGTVALMRQANPNLRAGDYDSIFRSSSKENVDGDSEFGSVTNLTYQRLDVMNAVLLASARRAGPLGTTGEVAFAGYGNDVAYDADGMLHMVYFDGIARTLKYVTRGSDGAVSLPQIVDTGDGDFGGYCSLALDRYGRPSVSYFDGTRGDLRFSRFDGEKWTAQTLDYKGSVGLYTSLTFDANDLPVVSYFRKTSGDLRVTRFDGTRWNRESVDVTNVVGRSTDIVFNKKTGELAVAYEDSTNGWLKLARRVGGTWTTEVVDNATMGVTHTSLAFDLSDRPAISYYDIYGANLKYSKFDGTSWATQRLASKGAQGLYTRLYFTEDGLANILYYNRKNNLVMKVSGDIPNWTAVALQSNGGRYIAATKNPATQSITYSWFEPSTAKLRIANVV
jgi:hypothetical protein